jgi:hypothetical protein
MPNPIKYSTSAQTLALKKGNYWIGTGDVGKGPTSTTDYYNGITPPSGGYTIYLNKASGGPSIYTAANDSQLISLSNTIAGQTFATAAAALAWFATQTDKMVFNADYPAIVTNGLVLNLDAGFPSSYPTSGGTWYDVSGNNNHATLVNSPTFSSASGGAVVFDGVDDYAYIPATNNLSFNNSSFTYSLAFSIPNWTFTSERIVLEYGDAGFNGYYQITFYPNETTFRTMGVSGYSTWFDTTVNFTANQNYIVTLTYNLAASLASLYINGTLVNSATITGTSQSTPRILYIYSRGGTRIFQKGNLYNILAYNVALSSSQVTQNFNAQKSRFGL